MISGSTRAAETIASLNVSRALLKTLKHKGLLSDQELNSLFAQASESMAESPLAQVKEAAEIVDSMKQETMS